MMSISALRGIIHFVECRELNVDRLWIESSVGWVPNFGDQKKYSYFGKLGTRT